MLSRPRIVLTTFVAWGISSLMYALCFCRESNFELEWQAVLYYFLVFGIVAALFAYIPIVAILLLWQRKLTVLSINGIILLFSVVAAAGISYFFMGKDLLEAIELLGYYLLPALFLVNLALGYQHAVTKCLLLLSIPILIAACKTTECVYSDRGGFTLMKVDSNTIFIEKMYPIGGLVILPFFLEKEKGDSLIFKSIDELSNITYLKRVDREKSREVNFTILDLEFKDTFLVNHLFINDKLYQTNREGVFNILIDSLPASTQDSFIVKFNLLGEFKADLDFDSRFNYVIYAHSNMCVDKWVDEVSFFKNKFYIDGCQVKGRVCRSRDNILRH